jgi:hypothetical protein
LLSSVASFIGIYSNEGKEEYKYISIRGEEISIYGKGVYKDMSFDVAIQGIAQDYITFFISIPFLIISLFFFRRESIRGLLVLSGTLMYFLVTYLFYTAMGMYNYLFLVYVSLLCLSFFAFFFSLLSYNYSRLDGIFRYKNLMKYSAIFLLINSIMVVLLWLSIILPPFIDGSIFPLGIDHYTTMIVQAFDLGLLLPIAIVSSIYALRKNIYGYLAVSIYLVFLSFLMLALSSKIFFMAMNGLNVIPVVFIMPTICLISIFFSSLIVKNIRIR